MGGELFFFFLKIFLLFSSDRKPEIFFSRSESQNKFFFQGKAKKKIFFFLNSMYARNVFF